MTTLNYFKNEPNSQQVNAGQVIFNAGDVADVMYAVKEGEMALIDNSPRSATCVARTAATIIPINQNRFVYMVQKTPYFALQVMGIMAERLRRTSALTGK